MNKFRKFLAVQLIIGAFINLSLNLGIAILLFKGIDPVPLWGNPGIALDILATAFLLPWLTVLIVAPIARAEMKKGTIERFREELGSIRCSYLRFMPKGVLAQSMIIGIGTTVIVAPAMVGILDAAGVSEMSHNAFIAYKTAFATVLTFPVSPVVWLSAMIKYV
jgi:hypothetical protein